MRLESGVGSEIVHPRVTPRASEVARDVLARPFRPRLPPSLRASGSAGRPAKDCDGIPFTITAPPAVAPPAPPPVPAPPAPARPVPPPGPGRSGTADRPAPRGRASAPAPGRTGSRPPPRPTAPAPRRPTTAG